MKPIIPSRVAEVIFALIFAYFGYLHFSKTGLMTPDVPHFFPGDPKLYVYVTGVGFIMAAIAIIINVQKTLACYLLAGVLLVFVFTIHLKPAMNGKTINIMIDAALAMACIHIGNRK